MNAKQRGAPKRIGFYISTEASDRCEAMRTKYGLSQGVMIERLLLSLTDEEYDRILKDAAKNHFTRRDAMKAITTMNDEEFKALAAMLAAKRGAEQERAE